MTTRSRNAVASYFWCPRPGRGWQRHSFALYWLQYLCYNAFVATCLVRWLLASAFLADWLASDGRAKSMCGALPVSNAEGTAAGCDEPGLWVWETVLMTRMHGIARA